MKIDGLSHPKTKELAYTLGVPLPHAIGLLELLWAFVGQQTPRGNIGKWSNAVIAGEAGWDKDPNEFVQALINIGFLDEDPEHRLLVHDWHDHALNWVHAKLKKTGQEIIRSDLRAHLRGDLSKRQETSYEATTSLVKSSQVKSSQKHHGPSDDGPGGDFERLWLKRPRRAGNDPKRTAMQAFNARMKAGVSVAEIEEGLNRYTAFCEATGKLHTEKVMQFVTFLGPSEPYLQDWALPKRSSNISSANDEAIARAIGDL